MLAYVQGSEGLPSRQLSQRALDIRGRQPTSSHFVSITFFHNSPPDSFTQGGQVQEGVQGRHISVMAEQSSQIESLILAVDACPPLALGPEIVVQDAQADVAEDLPRRGSLFI